MRMHRCLAAGITALCLVLQIGCSIGRLATPTEVAAVRITGATSTVRAGETAQFTATSSGVTNEALTWSVNGVTGGSKEFGTINSAGIYAAPATVPNSNAIVIRVKSASGTAQAETTVTLLNPVPAIASANIAPSVNGTALNISGQGFVPGSTAKVDGFAVPTQFVSSTSLLATADAGAAIRQVVLSIANPEPGSANSQNYIMVARPSRPSRTSYSQGAARFLDQSSFGPTAAEVANVQTFIANNGGNVNQGLSAYIDNQISLPQSSWNIPTAVPVNGNNNLCTGNLVTCFQILWFQNALTGSDQLRQRTAFALSQIWVISGNKVQFGDSYSTYYRFLNNDAFASYSQIINDITTSSAMGYYLDMGNSAKPANGQIANENYAREFLQLFTVGLYKLNDDGTYILDGNGNPQPAYSENDIQQIAKALTGWTYARNDQTVVFNQQFTNNSTNRSAPMVAVQAQHDTSPKTCDTLQCAFPNTTAAADLASVVQLVFQHSNVPPFVCKQMIQHMVTSNPSPQYVARCSAVFKNDGNNARGNMGAVVKAILLDPEARVNDAYASNDDGGHLREPVLYLTAITRGLANTLGPGTTYTAPNGSGTMTNMGATLVSSASNMGQNVLFAPSVFNYFPPDNVIPGTNTLGPEFLLFTTATSPLRANFVDSVIRNGVGTGIDFNTTINNYAAAAGTPNVLVDQLDRAFTYGQMSVDTKAAIVGSINAMPNVNNTDRTYRAKRAIYLVLTSSQYQIVH